MLRDPQLPLPQNKEVALRHERSNGVSNAIQVSPRRMPKF